MTAKVFVGNLVFSTTGDQLKDAFSPSAPVLSANIITRGRRSLGYGFVEFATEAEAEKAVAAMNKQEIDGRPINVELARPRDAAKEAEVREKKAARVAKPRTARPAKPEGVVVPVEGAAPVAEGAAAGAPGARRGGRKPRGPKNAAAVSSAPATEESAPAANGAAANGARGGRRGPRRGANAVASSSTGAAAAPQQPKRQTEARPISETTLFVANVPFSTDDAQLLSFFAEHKPKSAHVVRMRNGRSRGYGFVEFDDKHGQNAGLAVDGKEVPLPNGSALKLSVKVAMTPPPIQAADESAAPAAAAPGETPK